MKLNFPSGTKQVSVRIVACGSEGPTFPQRVLCDNYFIRPVYHCGIIKTGTHNKHKEYLLGCLNS
jgi:hypothetical protein